MFAAALSWPPWWRTELRIDVQLPQGNVEIDLERQYARLYRPGDALCGIARMPSPWPGLVLRHREADGEHFVYVEDVAARRLAGYTVFNRLVELDRRADRHLRSPHSRYAAAYQRRGIASAVYEWGLAAGMCLISGPRQSPGAHALWRSLGRRHAVVFVELRDKAMRLIGARVSASELDDFHTRAVMLGAGWSLEDLIARTGCRLPLHASDGGGSQPSSSAMRTTIQAASGG